MSKLTGLLPESYNRRAFDKFSPTTTFDPVTAGAMIWMSQLAYETDEPKKIEGVLKEWEMRLAPKGIIISPEVRTVLPMARTRGIFVSGRGARILAFAGTEPASPGDWLRNLNFRSDADGAAKGFLDAFDVVKDEVLALARARPADGPVLVTGHSLGGALAVVAAQELLSNDIDVAAVYTFGMPRPGNKAFAKGYDSRLGSRTYRLVHGSDIVTTVAPSKLGARHVGRLLRCNAGALFNPATLSDVPGPDKPEFVDNSVQRIAAAFKDPGSALAGLIAQFSLVGTIAIDQKPVHGRPPSVAVVVEALPPEIRDHLPDSYINALGAGPL